MSLNQEFKTPLKQATVFKLLTNLFFPLVCFRVFDADGDGFLSRSEIEIMCRGLIDIRKENAGEKVIQD